MEKNDKPPNYVLLQTKLKSGVRKVSRTLRTSASNIEFRGRKAGHRLRTRHAEGGQGVRKISLGLRSPKPKTK